MKKTKRFALAVMACLMSAMVMAGNRQVSTVLPAETPSVTVTLEGILDDVQSATSESNPGYAEIMDDVDYLNALCELGRGRRAKAYRQLKAISSSDNRHAHQAAELVKHFK